MANLLEQGAEWLEGKRHEHMTVPVVYQQDQLTFQVQATIGRTLLEVDGGRGILERIESRDFLIRSRDLVLGGVVLLPERGDTIRETQGEVVFIYEVMSPGQEPHFRYSDPFRKTLRIHTKQVGTEDAA